MIEPGTATLEVVCPGVLEVLSIGKGDLKITVGEERGDKTKARKLIEDMLRAGYAIFVETEEGLTRVKRFDSKHLAYVVVEEVKPKTKGVRRLKDVHVPVAGSRATAIGRTAGG